MRFLWPHWFLECQSSLQVFPDAGARNSFWCRFQACRIQIDRKAGAEKQGGEEVRHLASGNKAVSRNQRAVGVADLSVDIGGAKGVSDWSR